MSDLAIMVSLHLGLLGSALGLLWALRRSAEVRRDDEQMSGEWIERMRGHGR